MTRIRFRSIACSALLVSTFTLSGCLQSAMAERKYYLLDAKREGRPAAVHVDAALRVRRFSVDEGFATRSLVYRVDEFRYEPDYYHQFLVPPGVMITEKTRDWLAGSGLFRRVSSTSSQFEVEYRLEGNVIALYGDFRKESTPVAVMEIRIFLLANPDANETVPLAQTYRAESLISAKTAEAVVDAFGKDFDEILTRLEADLEKALARKADKSRP